MLKIYDAARRLAEALLPSPAETPRHGGRSSVRLVFRQRLSRLDKEFYYCSILRRKHSNIATILGHEIGSASNCSDNFFAPQLKAGGV